MSLYGDLYAELYGGLYGFEAITSGPDVVVPVGGMDHLALALARVPAQLTKSTTYLRLLEAMIWPVQELESVFLSLLTTKSITDSTGDALTKLGALVGQPQNGLDEDAYRRNITVKIGVNQSRAIPPDLRKIIKLLYPNARVRIRRMGGAVEIVVFDAELDDDQALELLGFLLPAVGAGIRLHLITFDLPYSEAFAFRMESATRIAALTGDTSLAVHPRDMAQFPAIGFILIDTDVYEYRFDRGRETMLLQPPGLLSDVSLNTPFVLCDAAGVEILPGNGWGLGSWIHALEGI